MSGVLETHLTVQPQQTSKREEFVAFVFLVNNGDDALIVNLGPLASPSLALELVDTKGNPAYLPPPPVPGLAATRITLAPGQQHVLEYRGFVPQWFAPGSYRVRLRYTNRPLTPEPKEWTGQLFSDWFEFTIGQ